MLALTAAKGVPTRLVLGLALAMTLVPAVTADARPAAEPSPLPACTIVGSLTADTIAGTSGDDVICGIGGNDRIPARAGGDIVFGSPGGGVLDGGPRRDPVDGVGGG